MGKLPVSSCLNVKYYKKEKGNVLPEFFKVMIIRYK